MGHNHPLEGIAGKFGGGGLLSKLVDPGRLMTFLHLTDQNVPVRQAIQQAGLTQHEVQALQESGHIGDLADAGDVDGGNNVVPSDVGDVVTDPKAGQDTQGSNNQNNFQNGANTQGNNGHHYGQFKNGDNGNAGHPFGQGRNTASPSGPTQGFSTLAATTLPSPAPPAIANSPILSKLFANDPVMNTLFNRNAIGTTSHSGVASRAPTTAVPGAPPLPAPNTNGASATIAVPRPDAVIYAQGDRENTAPGQMRRGGGEDLARGKPEWSQDIKQREGHGLDRRGDGIEKHHDSRPIRDSPGSTQPARNENARIVSPGQQGQEAPRADNNGGRPSAVVQEGSRANVANDTQHARTNSGNENNGGSQVAGDARLNNVQHRDAVQAAHTPGSNDNDGRRQGQSGDGNSTSRGETSTPNSRAASDARMIAQPAGSTMASTTGAAPTTGNPMSSASQTSGSGHSGDQLGQHAQLLARGDVSTAAPVAREASANLADYGRDASLAQSSQQQTATQAPPVRTDMQPAVQMAASAAAGHTAVANPQGAPTAQAPIQQPGGNTAVNGRDAIAMQAAGHTNTASLKRELRDGAHPRHKPVQWLLSMMAPGYLQAWRSRRTDHAAPVVAERAFWAATLSAYLALGCSIAALMMDGNHQLLTNTGSPTFSAYALGIAVVTSICALLLGRRLRRSSNGS